LKFSSMGTWSWAIGGGYPLASWSVDGAARAGGSSGSACADDTYKCVVTTRTRTNTYLPGFEYGPKVTGSTSASSYLWAATDGGGSATPFAQAYLRPKLRLADLAFPAMTAGGLPGATNRVLFDVYAKPQTYGVSGLANGFSTERDTEVRSMAQIDSRMFVGGNFAQVDRYADGSSVAQSYLAAFDAGTRDHAGTGDWIPSFRPTFNGKVNALAKLPSGLLAVGGEFTTVNGTPQAGLVVLDPGTGAVAPGFGVKLDYRPATGTKGGTVTSLGVQGSWLYVGGTFTHVAGGNPVGAFVYAKRGVRLDAGTGRPDSTWNPAFNAAPIFLTTSSSADRVYYGGFFTTMKDGATPAERFVTLTTASPAAPVGGLVDWIGSTTPRSYQQTGVETPDRFWLGGSEHLFYDFNRSDFSLVRPNISRSDDGPGGDFQASVVASGVAYGACHCVLSYVYGNSRTWKPPTDYDRIDTMRYVAAFDARTGQDLPGYLPWISTRAVRGPWALTVDANGCLWAGGDLTKTKRTTDSAWQSSGGFARFCPADSTAPTVPGRVTATKNAAGTVKVSWTGSNDASGPITYTVFRDNLAVATVSGLSATLPAAPGRSTYAVRAFDKAGNTSATTAPVTGP
jgi:trimeric autotransporter adhesin